MKSIIEIIKEHQSGFKSIKGYFYALGGENIKVFLSDNANFDEKDPIIMLPSSIADLVMFEDEILGVLVGGKYLYYSVKIEIEGDVCFDKEYAYFQNITKLTLFNEDLKQTFIS